MLSHRLHFDEYRLWPICLYGFGTITHKVIEITVVRRVAVNSSTPWGKSLVPQPHRTTPSHTPHCCSETRLREQITPLPPCQTRQPLPPAYLVDVRQCALTGELHRIHLHGRASLNDLILVAQGSHIEHEGLSGTNELIVHLTHEKAANQNENTQWLSSQFLPLSGVSSRVGYSESTHVTVSQRQLEKYTCADGQH